MLRDGDDPLTTPRFFVTAVYKKAPFSLVKAPTHLKPLLGMVESRWVEGGRPKQGVGPPQTGRLR